VYSTFSIEKGGKTLFSYWLELWFGSLSRETLHLSVHLRVHLQSNRELLGSNMPPILDEQSNATQQIDPFVFLANLRLVICNSCGFATVRDEVGASLRNKHAHIPIARRRQIHDTIQRLEIPYKSQAQLIGFCFPPPTILPIAALQPPRTDGKRCRTCGYIVCDERAIRAHCRNVHGWKNPISKGRPKSNQENCMKTSPWVDNVPCQRFFLSRHASRWFEVGRGVGLRRVRPSERRTMGKAGAASLDAIGLFHATLARENERARDRRAIYKVDTESGGDQ
jgi:hypothetical protein